jgi:hypothetical protein
MAICTSILKEENKTLIASPDEERSKEARLETEKLLQQGRMVGLDTYATDKIIKFKNGSTIEFIAPENECETIRGRRSKLPMWLYDYECCNLEEELDTAENERYDAVKSLENTIDAINEIIEDDSLDKEEIITRLKGI